MEGSASEKGCLKLRQFQEMKGNKIDFKDIIDSLNNDDLAKVSKAIKDDNFSRKEIEYAHGLCSKYSSGPKDIGLELREKLFPGLREVIHNTKDIYRMAKINSSYRVSKKQKTSEWTNCIV